MSQIILNGGIALGFYELAEQEGCLSAQDKIELDRLRNLKKHLSNRIEENGKPTLVKQTTTKLKHKT